MFKGIPKFSKSFSWHMNNITNNLNKLKYKTCGGRENFHDFIQDSKRQHLYMLQDLKFNLYLFNNYLIIWNDLFHINSILW